MDTRNGKDKCNVLRKIREQVAQENKIPYVPEKCDNDGPCSGSCPACDREEEYIDRCLREKESRGEEVKLVGLCQNMVTFSLHEKCDVDSSENRKEMIKWERKRENIRCAASIVRR